MMEVLATLVLEPVIEVWHLRPAPRGTEDQAPAPPPLISPSLSGNGAPGTSPMGAAAPSEEPQPVQRFAPLSQELEAMEKKRMKEALLAENWIITRAAKAIQMPERTFFK